MTGLSLLRTIAVLGAIMALPVAAFEIPPEGKCPPYPLKPGSDGSPAEDVAPPFLRPGDRVDLEALPRLRNYLPLEVWERRDIFFYEGMRLEIGPCHRRYPAPAFFEQGTTANHGKTSIDKNGDLLGYSGSGLPFLPKAIDERDPAAGWKWAWNYRYRYSGSGFRGGFRILHVMRHGKKIERFQGEFFMLPMHGVPGTEDGESDVQFWAGGSFTAPTIARGIAWRQRRPEEVNTNSERSDDIFVWLPDERRVRRAPPTAVDGIFIPSYTRAQLATGGGLNLPQGGIRTADPATTAVTEHWRRGFVGLLIRPNAYRFTFQRVQDVIAPINSKHFGHPEGSDRSYGPSGLSLATDRWELRRAVVLRGTRKTAEGKVASIILYVDALTLQPLYLISRRQNKLVYEVGIFMGRYTADDPLAPEWEGSGRTYGTIVPVAAAFFVSGGNSWLRESFGFRSDLPTEKDRRRFTTTTTLQRRGR